MHRILQLVTALLLLTGCQTATLSELDYNPKQDFSGWTLWQWADPDIQFTQGSTPSELDADRLRLIIDEELLQWGYLHNNQPDFLIRARLGREIHSERVYYRHSGYYDPWRRHRYWSQHYESGWLDSQVVSYPVASLQLDMLDAHTGKLAWRAQQQWPIRQQQSPIQREQALRKAVQQLLKSFPPN